MGIAVNAASRLDEEEPGRELKALPARFRQIQFLPRKVISRQICQERPRFNKHRESRGEQRRERIAELRNLARLQRFEDGRGKIGHFSTESVNRVVDPGHGQLSVWKIEKLGGKNRYCPKRSEPAGNTETGSIRLEYLLTR